MALWATLIALDPGGTTGWCVMSVHPESLVDPELRLLENVTHWSQGQFAGSEERQMRDFIELFDAWPDAPVLMERFTLRKFTKSDDLLSPVRLISRAQWLCEAGPAVEIGDARWELRKRPFDFQNPDAAKRTATDERLRDWGYYWREGGEEHARDATRHALTYLRAAKGELKGRRLQHMWPRLFGPGADLDLRRA